MASTMPVSRPAREPQPLIRVHDSANRTRATSHRTMGVRTTPRIPAARPPQADMKAATKEPAAPSGDRPSNVAASAADTSTLNMDTARMAMVTTQTRISRRRSWLGSMVMALPRSLEGGRP